MKHQKFHYQTTKDLQREMRALGADFPLSNNVGALLAPIELAGRSLPNRIAIQPMEGSDGTPDGAPSELTVRRYDRFAAGGAALIWFEAVSVAPEARASAHQLWLTESNLGAFQRLVERIRRIGRDINGYEPLIVMQATHSGRYSKPDGAPAPLIACNNPALEDTPVDASRILSDGQLRRYEEMFGVTARLARRAGFDAMDIKCCHRYLANELLGAYTRLGPYGGGFDNRARFLLNAYQAAQAEATSGFFLTSRMNVYDGFAYPWGIGVREGGGLTPALEEPISLIGLLRRRFKIPMLNITIGNPYRNPHVNRPYDLGNYVPDEHPLEGVARMMHCVSEVQKAHPDLPIVGSGFSYLRQFSWQLAAGMIETGGCSMAGFGRMAFANPDFPNRLKECGAIDPERVCITCGQCARLLRAGLPSGCIVRDGGCYEPVGGAAT